MVQFPDNAVERFSEFLDDKIVPPLRIALKGRKLVHVTTPQGFGITNVSWGTASDMSGGHVGYGFTDGNADKIDIGLSNAAIPVYWKDYEIDRRLYEGWMQAGVDIDTSNVIAAAYQAARTEDYGILQGISRDGGSTWEAKGLYQGAGLDYSTSSSVGTYGGGTSAVEGAMQLMDDRGVPVDSMKFNWAVDSVTYHRLKKSKTSMGIKEWPQIIESLNGGEIISVNNIFDSGTGVILPVPEVGQTYVDFFMTADFQNDLKNPEYGKTSNIGGRAFSAGILRIKQKDGICKTSNLT